MTIKELHETAPTTQIFYLVENGAVSPLNRDSVVTLAAYADFIIETIEARKENELEITLKMQPIKKKD